VCIIFTRRSQFAEKFDPFSNKSAAREIYPYLITWNIFICEELDRRDYQPSHQPAGQAIESDKAGNKKDRQGKGHFSDLSLFAFADND